MSFIDAHRETYGVEPICKELPTAPSTYYESKAREAGRAPCSATGPNVTRSCLHPIELLLVATSTTRGAWRGRDPEQTPHLLAGGERRLREARAFSEIGLRAGAEGLAVISMNQPVISACLDGHHQQPETPWLGPSLTRDILICCCET